MSSHSQDDCRDAQESTGEQPLCNAALQQESSPTPPPKRGIIGRPFKLGQSGNPSGRRKGSVSLKAALMRVLTRRDAERIGRELIERAKSGDVRAVRTLADLLGEISGTPVIAVANVTAHEAQLQRELAGLSVERLRQIIAFCEARKRSEMT